MHLVDSVVKVRDQAGPARGSASGWLYDLQASKGARVTLILGFRGAVRPPPDRPTRLLGDAHREAAPQKLRPDRVKQLPVACRALVARQAARQGRGGGDLSRMIEGAQRGVCGSPVDPTSRKLGSQCQRSPPLRPPAHVSLREGAIVEVAQGRHAPDGPSDLVFPIASALQLALQLQVRVGAHAKQLEGNVDYRCALRAPGRRG